MQLRSDWTLGDIRKIYETPLLELVYRAATIHREHHNPQEVQRCTLLSIKTGGCPENCAYCPQSAHYETPVAAEPLMMADDVLKAAQQAKDSGSSRFCMGAAWRKVRDNDDFDRVLEMVRGVNELGLEVCCTLGMLTEYQAKRLAEAGVFAYNHNVDTSESYYSEIISTRQHQDRMETLKAVRGAGMTICSGGIIGLGESVQDRVGMLHTLATLKPHPESVPINALVAVEGTPLEKQKPVPAWEMARTIATARCVMPKSVIRLSAGRTEMSIMEQAFCFMAGANSIFTGDRLLTTPNPEINADDQLFEILGLNSRPAFKKSVSDHKTDPETSPAFA